MAPGAVKPQRVWGQTVYRETLAASKGKLAHLPHPVEVLPIRTANYPWMKKNHRHRAVAHYR
jgi:hypothetical protein